MKEAVTKVIDTLTQKDFHGAFKRLLERYTTCVAAGGDYFKADWNFMCVLSIKVPIGKKCLETYRMRLVLWDLIEGRVPSPTRKNALFAANFPQKH